MSDVVQFLRLNAGLIGLVFSGISFVVLLVGAIWGLKNGKKLTLRLKVGDFVISEDAKRPDALSETKHHGENMEAVRIQFGRFFNDSCGDVANCSKDIADFYHGYIVKFLRDHGVPYDEVLSHDSFLVINGAVSKASPIVKYRMLTSVFRNDIPHRSKLLQNTEAMIARRQFVDKTTDSAYRWYHEHFEDFTKPILNKIEKEWNYKYASFKQFKDYVHGEDCNDILPRLIRFYDDILLKRGQILFSIGHSDPNFEPALVILSMEGLYTDLGIMQLLNDF